MSTWNLASVLLQERRDVERPKAKGEVAAGRGAQMGSRWAGAGAVMGRQALLQGLALGGRRGGGCYLPGMCWAPMPAGEVGL